MDIFTRYTLKLTLLGDRDYSNMIIEETKIIVVITMKDTYSS